MSNLLWIPIAWRGQAKEIHQNDSMRDQIWKYSGGDQRDWENAPVEVQHLSWALVLPTRRNTQGKCLRRF